MEIELPKQNDNQTHLGDGVYCIVNNGSLTLKTQTDEIHIEGFVLFALINFALQKGIIKNV